MAHDELKKTFGYRIIADWLAAKGFKPFAFQEECWQHIIKNESGLVNAPTGCGKTFSVFLGALIQFINEHPDDFQKKKETGPPIIMDHTFTRIGQGYRPCDGRSNSRVGYELAGGYQEW